MGSSTVVTIREERPGDAEAIHRVHATAFPTDEEARLVDELRASGDVVVSLVATAGDAIIGHVLYSRLSIIRSGKHSAGVALAPVSVLPAWRRRGVADRLIRDGLAAVREMGTYAVAIVLGDPAYYGRFGFSPTVAAQFRSPYSGTEAYQALALDPHAAGSELADVSYPRAFQDLA